MAANIMDELGMLPADPGRPLPEGAARRKLHRSVFDWVDQWPERGVQAGAARDRVAVHLGFAAGPDAFALVMLGATMTPAVARELAKRLHAAADQVEQEESARRGGWGDR